MSWRNAVAFGILVGGALALGWIKRCHLFDDPTDRRVPGVKFCVVHRSLEELAYVRPDWPAGRCGCWGETDAMECDMRDVSFDDPTDKENP